MDRAELNIGPDTPVAFVDIETTGGHQGLHRVIDIAVIGATGDRLDFKWQTLVAPGVHIPPGITALTGIDDSMVAEAPTFERIAGELHQRLAGRVFVAHNVRFDYGFIRREFARAGREWRSEHLCTVRLSRALYPQMPRHNLDAVMEHHGISVAQRHRAMPDAQVLWQLWRKLRRDWPHDELQAAIERAAPPVVLPPQLPADLADDLPEEPGVYRFFGEGEALLYVCKANNLRERVLEHFRGGALQARSQRMKAELRRVEWTVTAGPLGAWLLEAREIRERQPAYNRQLRRGENLTWLFDDAGNPPRLVPLDALALETGNAFGTWRTDRDARRALEELAREHRWCFKVLGLESGPGSCVGFQMGRCKGACTGKESARVHVARVKLALMPQRLKPWPHPGPMIWREGAGERTQYHVIDCWQHLGCVHRDDEDALHHWRRRANAQPFDMDAYRILTRQLRDERLLPLPHS